MQSDSISRLPPAQLQQMHEAFQVLDRDGDGQVNRDDVVDVLKSLGASIFPRLILSPTDQLLTISIFCSGQISDPQTLSVFFPPSTSQTITLPAFLSLLSNLLAPLSSSYELNNAFSAFDDDDSGQIDIAELRDALLHTAPDQGEEALSERDIQDVLKGFTGRREFAGRGGIGMGMGAMGGSGKRGDVFKYREFVGSVAGSAGANKVAGVEDGVVAAQVGH